MYTKIDEQYRSIETANNSVMLLEFQEQQRKLDQSNSIYQLTYTRELLETEKKKILEERQKELTLQLTAKKDVWQQHELKVAETIKNICQKYNLQYHNSSSNSENNHTDSNSLNPFESSQLKPYNMLEIKLTSQTNNNGSNNNNNAVTV